VSIIMLRIDYRKPLGLMIRPAAWIVRELPPSQWHTMSPFASTQADVYPLVTSGVRLYVVEKGNEKGHLQLRPVGALPDISPTKASGKAERMCKWPQLLPPTATIKL